MESQEHLRFISGIKEDTVDDSIRSGTTAKLSSNSPWDLLRGLKYRKIMRRTDMLKILFVCVCVCHVCPAHPCGDNPMRLIDSYSRARGMPSEQLLNAMQLSHRSDYTLFMREYRKYLDCTQMVQNGYFKRSVDGPMDKRRQSAPFVEATWDTNRRQLLQEIADEILSGQQEMESRIPEAMVPRWVQVSTAHRNRDTSDTIRTVPSLLKRIRKYVSTYETPEYENEDADALSIFSDVTDEIKR